MISAKEEISDFIKSIAGNNLLQGPYMSVPCDIYDDKIRIGFIIHKAQEDSSIINSSLSPDRIAIEAEKAGFRLIQLWEDLWQTKKLIIQSRLRSVYGKTERVFARKTKILKIDKPEMNGFLEKNHLQGVANAGYKYGLYYNDRLIAIATFSKGRSIDRLAGVFRSYELIRYCSLLNTTVVGGLDKLLKHFMKDKQPDDIMTYADRDWSDGSVYKKLGFEQMDIVGPQTFWVDPDTGLRIFPNKTKQLIDSKRWDAGEKSDPTSVLIAHGYRAVYNAGSLKFILMLKGRS